MKRNEYGAPLDRNGYAPSIVQHTGGHCFACGCSCKPLQRHEVFFGANREKSKNLGLWVELCADTCHIYGPNAVHNNRTQDLGLKQIAQAAAMREYGWTTAEVIRRIGRNYLEG